MSTRWLFAAIGLLAAIAGTLLWLMARPSSFVLPALTEAPTIAPAAVMAMTFTDEAGARHSLARFQGRVVVLNFWATWCGPCRDEMPAFKRLQARWADRGVQFVGVSDEDPRKAASFGRELGINYPLWTGGAEVGELSRRLGNRVGGLPHTVIFSRSGEVLQTKLGSYTEGELEALLSRLVEISAKTS